MATPSAGFAAPPAVQPIKPWSPTAAWVNAILLGPMAAALVAYLSLKRMGAAAKAKQTLLIGLIGSAILIPVLIKVNLPSYASVPLSLMIGGFCANIQQPEFKAWQVANPGVDPRSAWASLGWGLLGLLGFLCMAFVIATVFILLGWLHQG